MDCQRLVAFAHIVRRCPKSCAPGNGLSGFRPDAPRARSINAGRDRNRGRGAIVGLSACVLPFDLHHLGVFMDHRPHIMGSSALRTALSALALSLVFTACDGEKKPDPAPQAEPATADPAAKGEPAKAEPAKAEPAKAEPVAKAEPAAAEPAAAEPAAAEPAAADPTAAEPVKADPAAADPAAADPTAAEPVKADPAAADPAAAPVNPDAVAKAAMDEKEADELVLPEAGAIVTNPKAGTPQAVIMTVLAAANEPDEEKAWQLFKAQLHSREMLPNALKARRSLNFAASRRKVKLFLVENPDAPGVLSYKVSYIETPGEDQLKIFVHNAKASPTPCYVAKDPEQDNAWKVTTCSL
ncbi:MAG: hypothetical protein ACI9MR_003440 [Myxococcota bacterium]|jgi:hypothetical protein